MSAPSWPIAISPLAPWNAGQHLLHSSGFRKQHTTKEGLAVKRGPAPSVLPGYLFAAPAPDAPAEVPVAREVHATHATSVSSANTPAAHALQRAATRKDTQAVAEMLDAGLVEADTEIYDWTEYITVTALFISVYLGDCSTVELLLDRGANIDFVATKSHAFGRPWYSSRSHTPVAVAAENGDEAMVELLLRRGADVDIETVDVEGRWGGTMDGNMWERAKRPSYWCSVKARRLAGLMEQHSAESKLQALEQSVLKEALEDHREGPVELTPAITRRLLDEIIQGGLDQLDSIMEMWGFEDQVSMEKALRSQVLADTSGKLQRKFDQCLAVLSKNLSVSDLLFDGDFTMGGTGG